MALLGAVFLPLAVNTSPVAIQQDETRPIEVKLSTATVKFHTKDEDKEKDTAASLYIKLNDGTLVAQIENIKDYFKDRTTSTYPLKVLKEVLKSKIEGCTGTVKTTKEEGHDPWKFEYQIEFVFSDDSRIQKSCPAATINENAPPKVCSL